MYDGTSKVVHHELEDGLNLLLGIASIVSEGLILRADKVRWANPRAKGVGGRKEMLGLPNHPGPV